MSMTARVKRYWPGRAPDWAAEAKEEADLRTSSSNRNRASFQLDFRSDNINSADDPRLRRLAQTRAIDRDEIRADHRRIRQAEIVSTAEDEDMEDTAAEDEEEDDDAVEEKRRRIIERLLQLRREDEDEDAVSTVEDEDDEYESEYETESEEEEEAIRREMAKPVYVRKQERETIVERERLEAVLQALVEAENRKIAERRPETKQIVVEMIREDYELLKSSVENKADVGDVDTDDEVNEAEEYESWKVREIARIKRDREAMNKRVRIMTEQERREWERKYPKSRPCSAPKKKRTFMQTYYHKGSFFQDSPDDPAATMGTCEIYLQDFSAPTGDDKLNKSILPKVMQVKHFGRSGRTKWTHLVNEDTTRKWLA